MKVAITGANGYVGSLLARAHLRRGDQVNALSRNPAATRALEGVTVYSGDITRAEAIDDGFFDVDVFYHCAAEVSHEDLMRAVNVEGTRGLLARARGRAKRWVQLSSLSVYGNPRSGVVDEASAPRPRTLYGRTKLEADELVTQHVAGAFGYAFLRPAAVIGPNMRGASMRALIGAVERGRFCFIGAPGAIGNFVHEDNLVEALVLLGTHSGAAGRAYNLSENVTIESMIATIAAAIQRPVPALRLPESLARAAARVGRVVPAFPLTPARVDALTSRVEYASERIARELGYRPRATVHDALRQIAADRQRGLA